MCVRVYYNQISLRIADQTTVIEILTTPVSEDISSYHLEQTRDFTNDSQLW